MAWKIMVCSARMVLVPFVLVLTLLVAPFSIGFGLILLVFFLVVNTIGFISAAIANDRERASETLPALFKVHIPQWLGVLGRLLLAPVRWTLWAFEPFRQLPPDADADVNAD